jgi:hypothetical protein
LSLRLRAARLSSRFADDATIFSSHVRESCCAETPFACVEHAGAKRGVANRAAESAPEYSTFHSLLTRDALASGLWGNSRNPGNLQNIQRILKGEKDGWPPTS